MNNKGFSIIEILVSFVIISFVTISMFSTVVYLMDKITSNITTVKTTIINGDIVNSVSKDLYTKKLYGISSCGANCYDITFQDLSVKRLQVSNIDNTIKYGGITLKYPSDTIIYGNMILSNDSFNNPDKNNNIIKINVPVKNSMTDKINDINIVYQYDEEDIGSLIPFELYSPDLEKNMVSFWNLDNDYKKKLVDVKKNIDGYLKIKSNLYYPFSGNTNDYSISLDSGTSVGATLTTDRFNNSNSAYSFNGTSNYIVNSTNFAVNTSVNNYLISAWIYTESNPSSNFQALIMDDNGSGVNNASFGIAVKNDGTGLGAWACGNLGSWANANLLNGWHHVAAVYTANATAFTPVRMYVDGVYVGNSATGRTTACSLTTRIGIGNKYVGYNTWFKGKVDEVILASLSNTPTDSDISKLYSTTNVHDQNDPLVSGKKGGAYELWGVSSVGNTSIATYLDMGTSFNNIVGGIGKPFSISYWLYKKPGTGGNGSGRRIGWYGGNYKGAFVKVEDNGMIGFILGQGNTTGSNSNYDYLSTAGTFVDNQWNHIVLTYDGTDVKLYLNNTVLNTYNIGQYVDNGVGQNFHVNKSPWDFYTAGYGIFDEIGLWSRGLTAEEVDKLYKLNYQF